MKTNDYFSSHVVAKPEFQLLPQGIAEVRLLRFEVLDSFTQFNGTVKDDDKLPEWIDPTVQLAITVVSAEKGKSGGLTHRFNGGAFAKYDQLSDEQRDSGNYENLGGYACKLNKQGKYERIPDPEKTKSCDNIMNQFANALRIPEGTLLLDGLAEARDDQRVFQVTVTNDEYKGKDQYRLSKFKAVTPVAVNEDFE